MAHNPLPSAAEAPPGLDQAREWLAYVKPRPQDQRARVAFALFDGWGDAAESVFMEWIRTHPKHDAASEREGRTTWLSARKPGPVTWRKLRWMAENGGWCRDPNAPPPRRLSAAELAHQQAEREAKAAQAAAERRARADAAAADAVQRLAAGDQPDQAPPYLAGKGVAPTQDMRQEGSTLLVPVTRIDGTVRGLQLIAADGTKRFSRGTLHEGHLWWARPPADESAPQMILIAEGVATSLTVAAAVDGVVDGAAVACAWSAWNILVVAAALHDRWPAAKIVIAGDNDEAGRRAAEETAKATGAAVALPTFEPGAMLNGKPAKDWNDLQCLAGLDEVRHQLLDAPPTDTLPPAEPPADPAADTDPPAASLMDLPREIPFGEGTFVVRSGGVYYMPPPDSKGNVQSEHWICARLDVLAITRSADRMDWGWLVAWRDRDGVSHRLVIAAEQLAGDGAEVRRELARGGLAMASGRMAREWLGSYISSHPQPVRAWCVSRAGWYGSAYVTPSRVFGTTADGLEVVFQHAGAPSTAPAISGTLDDWKQYVAALAVGNSRLVLVISAAFAGAVLDILGLEGGGLHLNGPSSTGKSTAQVAGASVSGNPTKVVRSWRNTPAGLEGVAVQHNDGTLFLEEIGEADPRQVGLDAYMLANGQQKQRASPTGAARPTTTWRTLFVSTGELSMAAHMATAGRRPAAGQELRIVDIAADAGAGHGLFEDLHGHPNARALADALRDVAGRFHGTAGPAWLAWLAERRQALTDRARKALGDFVARVLADAGNPSAQAGRVARRFGAIAVAGELATLAGITGWPRGEATRAAQVCFFSWLEAFGHAPAEERALLDGVREFVERHGASRFRDFTSASHVVHHLAGYYRIDDGRRVYLFHRTGLAEACRGADLRWAVRMLIARGWIRPGTDGRPTHHLRPDGASDLRLYLLDPTAWADEN